MLKVCQRPELIQQLNHGLTFADDATVNEQLLIKYSLWQYLTPCDADNVNILNSCINRWRDEANKLYETTRFSYDPLSNFQYNETGKDIRTPDLTDERTPDLTDETTLGTDTTRAEAGYDVPRTLFDAEKTTNSGTDTVTHTGTDTITHTGTDTMDHTLDRTGRSNVASQDLIAKERAIILDCISWYVEKFRNCFTVSLDINDYCCDRDLEPIADFLPPECGHGPESLTGKLDVIDNEIGALQQQLTDCCGNMSTEIEDLKKSVADSKDLLAAAISDKGVPTAGTDTFQVMADNIAAIQQGNDPLLLAHWPLTNDTTNYDIIGNYYLSVNAISTSQYQSDGVHIGHATNQRLLQLFDGKPLQTFIIEFTIGDIIYVTEGDSILRFNQAAISGSTRYMIGCIQYVSGHWRVWKNTTDYVELPDLSNKKITIKFVPSNIYNATANTFTAKALRTIYQLYIDDVLYTEFSDSTTQANYYAPAFSSTGYSLLIGGYNPNYAPNFVIRDLKIYQMGV